MKNWAMKYNNYITLFSFVGLLFFLVSCSNIKYLPQGENLYVKGVVKLEGDNTCNKKYIKPLEELLEGNLRPSPNSSILGLRHKLFIYNLARSAKTEKGIKGWLKYKVGE